MLLDQAGEAMKDFEKAVRCNDKFPIALIQKLYTDYRLAFTNRNASGIQKAMDAFEQAIQQFPKCPECYLLYAQVPSWKMTLILTVNYSHLFFVCETGSERPTRIQESR
jgi:tetratricopeptide (TPR) repeat protein